MNKDSELQVIANAISVARQRKSELDFAKATCEAADRRMKELILAYFKARRKESGKVVVPMPFGHTIVRYTTTEDRFWDIAFEDIET